jgi:hypothetical protein
VALLLLNGTPREFIHTFTGHQDTIDHLHLKNHADHHAAFEKEHHHCAFLNITLPIFSFYFETFQIKAIPVEIFYFDQALLSFISHERKHTALRGPPLV